MSKIANILDKAADLIEPEGAWVQRLPVVGELARRPAYCAWGAIVFGPNISASFGERQEAYYFASRATTGDLIGWNDARGRTQAEVVAKLREAAALARDRDAAQRRREAAEAEGQQPGPQGIAQKEI